MTKTESSASKNGPHLLTVGEVANVLSVSTKQVRRWIDSGELPHHRFGRSIRIHPDDLESFIAKRRNARPL